MLRTMKTHYNYLVIGGGSGGVASARRAAKHGASALVIEAKQMGGTCVNVGCVPKKIMWYTSDMAHKLKIAKDYGFEKVEPEFASDFNWGKIKSKRDAYIKRLNGIYERNMTKEGVDYIYGWAKFTKDGKVEVVHKEDSSKISTFTADNVLIATGGTPVDLDIPGAKFGIDSDGFFELEEKPKRVAIVGAGYIGVEFAGVFNGLGSETHLVIRGETVLRKFDEIIQHTITDRYIKTGVNVHKKSSVTRVTKKSDGSLSVELNGGAETLEVDTLIWTVGRKSLIPLGVKDIGLELNSHDQVIVDEFQRTNISSVYSLGDVVGNVELTPVAIATGRRLSNRLFGPEKFKAQKMDFENIPSVVFSHPEAGTIGLTEKEAVEKYGEENIKVYTSKFTSMYYSMVEDQDEKDPTAYKLVCLKPENEKVIGLHIVGDDSAEILQGFGVAIKMGATKQDFDNCVAIHPTSAEELVTMV